MHMLIVTFYSKFSACSEKNATNKLSITSTPELCSDNNNNYAQTEDTWFLGTRLMNDCAENSLQVGAHQYVFNKECKGWKYNKTVDIRKCPRHAFVVYGKLWFIRSFPD